MTVVSADEIDVRLGRPPAPERLSDEERALWEKLTFSRRPGWFSGAESLLESYVTTAIHCQRLEAALRKAKPSTSDRYQRLARMHRQSVALAASLAPIASDAVIEARQAHAHGRRAASGLGVCP